LYLLVYKALCGQERFCLLLAITVCKAYIK
jgi:hypothetical protein